MWRFGPSGERTLCNACGVRQKRIEAKLVKDKKRSDAIARSAAHTAERLATRGGNPIKPRTWIRPSRSKAAVAARERALSEDNENSWLLEKWDCGDCGDCGDRGDYDDDVDMRFCCENNASQNDAHLYSKCCEGGEMYGDGWCVQEEWQNMDDLFDSDGFDDFVDIDDFYDVNNTKGDIEKIRTNAPLSPRSPFTVMM